MSGVAAQTIEAQPASGQIKPKEDAAVRARHDRGIGDAWLAVGPSKDRGLRPWSDLARRLQAQAEQAPRPKPRARRSPDHVFVDDRRQTGRQA